ncbi:MAG TPA: hypothetical protein DCW60_03245 [Sutterella sp.]|nr:hypothetical protein [Sutterella sp.]
MTSQESNANPRKIDIYALSADQGGLEFEVSVADLPNLSSFLADDKGSLHVAYVGTKGAKGMPGGVLVMTGLLNLTCVTCGKPVVFEIDREVPFLFAASQAALDNLPVSDDMGYEVTVGSREFDLVALVEEEAILSLPAYPKHRGCALKVKPLEEETSETKRFPFKHLKDLMH